MFTLSINTDNAAFSDGNHGNELARILRQLAQAMEQDTPHVDESGHLRDINGNRVGEWTLQLTE